VAADGHIKADPGVVDVHPVQKPGQAGQLDQFVAAIRTARQVSLDGCAVGWSYRTDQVDAEPETSLSAIPGAGHNAQPEFIGAGTGKPRRCGCLH
jgi:hypothetical protein